jgi:hypothetical protein
MTDEWEFKQLQQLGARYYESALLPEDIQRGEVGQCFDTCIMQAMACFPKYKYVEGYAKPSSKKHWILHAWLTDGEHALDPTWRATEKGADIIMPATYYGIILDIQSVFRFMMETGYQGVLANAERNPKLARQAMDIELQEIKNFADKGLYARTY